jgi:hypothetical protein
MGILQWLEHNMLNIYQSGTLSEQILWKTSYKMYMNCKNSGILPEFDL